MKSKLFLSSLAAVLLGGSAQAQYTDNNQTNTISGVTSNWVDNGTYVVGSNWVYDALIIQNSGVFSNGFGYIGYEANARNNAALVTGSGSVWDNANDLYVGYIGSGNSLTLTNGGNVSNGNGYIGNDSQSGSNNTVLVTGSGSVWNNTNDLYVGVYGSGNSLTISSSGTVHNGIGYIGFGNGANSNSVLVTGPGSVWNNTNDLYVGNYGAGDSLIIASSGTVYNSNAHIGFGNGANNNSVLVTGPGSVWNVSNIDISESGLDNFLTVSNGGYVQATTVSIANQPSSSGALIVAGGTNEIFIGLNIGVPGSTGTVTVAGGALIVSNLFGTASTVVNGSGSTLILGAGTFKTDSLTLTNGGKVEYVQTYQVDNASVTVAGGTVQADSSFVVAPSTGSTGTVNVTGGQLVVTNGTLGVGNDGTATNGFGVGSMTVSDATVLASTILLGSSAGGQGSLTIQTNGVVSLDSGAAGTNAAVVANDLILDGGLLSMTNGTLYCGNSHPGAMMMSNGAAACGVMYVGYDYSGSMSMLAGQMTVSSFLEIGHLAGSTGSVWMSSGQFAMTNLPTTVGNSGVGQLSLSNGTIQASTVFVGNTGGPGGTLSVSGGTLTLSGDLKVGTPTQATGTVWVTGGQLLVGGAAITVGNSSGKGQLTISNGVLQANSLVLTNGTKSVFRFSGGSLISSGTSVTNGQNFLVGNGSSAAVFSLLGGTHSFANNLEITNNGTLTGCGTINGSVLADAGARVVATCGTLTFTGIVTNNGTMRAINGSVLEFYGPVVNNGLIDIIGGSSIFHSTFSNNGALVDVSYFHVVRIAKESNDIRVTWNTVDGLTNVLQVATGAAGGSFSNNFTDLSPAIIIPGTSLGATNYLDIGGATNTPTRYYRVRLVP